MRLLLVVLKSIARVGRTALQDDILNLWFLFREHYWVSGFDLSLLLRLLWVIWLSLNVFETIAVPIDLCLNFTILSIFYQFVLGQIAFIAAQFVKPINTVLI